MYKLKRFLSYLSYLYISFICRGKIVYVVNGARRSGNHAFINWLSNAIDNEQVNYTEISYTVSKSTSGKIVFFNEVNFLGVLHFISSLRKNKESIKKANYIIISLEDYITHKYDTFVPMKAIKIAITRSTLNLISSRLKRAINVAELGLCRGDMVINQKFIDCLYALREANNWKVWHYDSWVEDKTYRNVFLNGLGFSFDLSSSVSIQGGGSSFTGSKETPNVHDVLNRWEKIIWPQRIVELLNDNPRLLTETEKKFLANL